MIKIAVIEDEEIVRRMVVGFLLELDALLDLIHGTLC